MWARGKDSVYYYFFNTYYLRKYSILYQNHKFTECCTNFTQTHRRIIYWITLRKDIYKWYGNTLIYQNFLLNILFKPKIILHKLLEYFLVDQKLKWLEFQTMHSQGEGCALAAIFFLGGGLSWKLNPIISPCSYSGKVLVHVYNRPRK